MDVSQEAASFDHVYLKHLLSFLAEIKSRYFYKGFNPEEINNKILRNLLNISYNANPSLNWNSLTTTTDFYHVKNLTNFDAKNSEITLVILQELKRLKKLMNPPNDELDYKEIADFFLYRLEKNSFFELYSSSNGSNSPLSGENNNSDMENNLNYKLNPLILYEENYNELQNLNNFLQHTGKIYSTVHHKRKKHLKNSMKINEFYEKLEKKKKNNENNKEPIVNKALNNESQSFMVFLL